MDYTEKYLKYKNKYRDLQSKYLIQLGGNNNIVQPPVAGIRLRIPQVEDVIVKYSYLDMDGFLLIGVNSNIINEPRNQPDQTILNRIRPSIITWLHTFEDDDNGWISTIVGNRTYEFRHNNIIPNLPRRNNNVVINGRQLPLERIRMMNVGIPVLERRPANIDPFNLERRHELPFELERRQQHDHERQLEQERREHEHALEVQQELLRMRNIRVPF